MNKKYLTTLVIIVFITALAACKRGGDGLPEFDPDFVGTDDPNTFMQFLNDQTGLPAGDYTLVAGTATRHQSGNFTITVEFDNGTNQNFSGSWSNSGGPDEMSSENPRFTFTQSQPGGIHIAINSNISTCLYLLDRGDSIIAGIEGVNVCATPKEIALATSQINLADNAAAYYRAIDPDNTRDTLENWKQANGFGQACGTIDPCEVHVIFRDSKDLGYGRSMFARRNDDGSVGVYVENFQVDAVPGQGYTLMNLQAAIQNQRRWHFGSNAIEFSAYPYGSNDPKASSNARMFTKFYSFVPDNRNDPNTTERRVLEVNLDNRGNKSMPGPCITCHGGKNRPMLRGELPAPIPGSLAGDLQAHMQAIEVHSLDFSTDSGYTRADLEAGLKFINEAILSTYQITQQQNDALRPMSDTPIGYWNPDFASLMIKGWYGGNINDPNDAGLPNERFSDDFVPPGWRPDPIDGSPPASADELFKTVVGPHCTVCHSKRGTELQDDIDFSTYEKFISHAAQIESFVFDRGLMPLGLLNFDSFWDASNKAPLLGSFLADFSHGNSDGTTLQPGRPVGIIAAPRRSKTPMTLSGQDSAFATSFQWSIINAPSGSNPTLSDTSSARPVLNTDMDGDYTLQLIVNNRNQQSTAKTVTISIANNDPSLIAPRDLRFSLHIKPVLQSDAPGPDCDSCHADPNTAANPRYGIPLYYTDAQAENRVLYNEVRARINFKTPLDSLLLRKPSDNHHNGGLRAGFDLEGDRSYYDLFLSWILEGALQ